MKSAFLISISLVLGAGAAGCSSNGSSIAGLAQPAQRAAPPRAFLVHLGTVAFACGKLGPWT